MALQKVVDKNFVPDFSWKSDDRLIEILSCETTLIWKPTWFACQLCALLMDSFSTFHTVLKTWIVLHWVHFLLLIKIITNVTENRIN